MANQIKQILAELYAIDESLKKHETELIRIIDRILANRPDTKFDINFAKRLRAELLAKAGESQKTASLFNNLIENFMTKKIAYLAGSVVLTALILVPVLTYFYRPGTVSFFSDSVKISRLGTSAFGSLSGQAATNLEAAPMGLGAGDSAAGSAIGLGGGGGNASGVARMQAGGGGMATSPIIAPEYVTADYNYVYTGEPITLTDEKLSVLKRIRTTDSNGQLDNLLKSFNLGLADLSGFPDSRIQNITFTQDQSYGYVINVNLDEGAVTIYNNWQTWPQSQCQNENCYEQYRTKESDLLPDETLIKIANDFMAEHKISLKNYGTPFVDNSWNQYYQTSPDKTNYYFPDSLQIIYPLVINGQKVYEGHGYPAGLNVSVHLKERRVTGVTGLTTQNYQSSSYPAVTDVARVMAWVKKGGIFNYGYYGGEKTYDVKLGEAEMGYFRQWNYKNNTNEELLVPALIFPVTKGPEFTDLAGRIAPYYYKLNVVVPIISEVLDEFEAQDLPPIRPLPLTEPAEAPAVDLPTDQTQK